MSLLGFVVEGRWDAEVAVRGLGGSLLPLNRLLVLEFRLNMTMMSVRKRRGRHWSCHCSNWIVYL